MRKKKSKKAARPKSPTKKKAVPKTETADFANLSSKFSENRGHLPWPVDNGFITRYFGKQSHPALRRIQVSNNGIDIQTAKSQEVKSVFEGDVVGLQFIPGNNYMLIIRHGSYFTVYSNLEEAFVKRGDRIKLRQVIGKVGIDKISNQSELHFEVWWEKSRKNPMHWLKRKT